MGQLQGAPDAPLPRLSTFSASRAAKVLICCVLGSRSGAKGAFEITLHHGEMAFRARDRAPELACSLYKATESASSTGIACA